MGARVHRLTPALPVQSVQTFSVAAPQSTHRIYVSCREVECAGFRYGFRLEIDETTDQGRMQAAYLRDDGVPEATPAAAAVGLAGRRRYTESRLESGLTAFTYPAGTPCFQEHTRRLERPEIFLVRGGDWRGNPRGDVRHHTTAAHWVEEFAEHQDRLATAHRKG